MPCRVELSDAEIEANRRARTEKEIAKVVEPLQKRNDELTHENDQLREIILRIADKDSVPVELWKKIQKDQIEHRKEDLSRLESTFLGEIGHWASILPATSKSLDMITKFAELLTKVTSASPAQPLEPQLGFDPDSY